MMGFRSRALFLLSVVGLATGILWANGPDIETKLFGGLPLLGDGNGAPTLTNNRFREFLLCIEHMAKGEGLCNPFSYTPEKGK